MDIKTLHNQMGHSSVLTTLKYYAAPTDEIITKQVEKIEGLFTVSG